MSDQRREAKFYTLTKRGQRQLDIETENWNRVAGAIGRVLQTEA